MAADGVQRLDLKDLDAVLARAKSERWAELGLISSTSIASAEDQAKHLTLKVLAQQPSIYHCSRIIA